METRVRLTAIDERTGRALGLRLAQFAFQERQGRFAARFDSFDAVKQALRYQIDLSAVAWGMIQRQR